MHILFDKNVPVGVRRFLPKHEVQTVVDMQWPDQLENGELLKVAEQSGFDVLVTADQNIRYQQNLTGRKLSLLVLGSNIWRRSPAKSPQRYPVNAHGRSSSVKESWPL